MTVAVVDHGLCNIDSMVRAAQHCGAKDVVVADHPAAIAGATRLILPGVGAFPAAMESLESSGLKDALDEAVRARGIPVLGVCLGMQLMAKVGTEHSPTAGLGWIDAAVERLVPLPGERVPHVGWNEVHHDRGAAMFDSIETGTNFYFVHSYHVVLESELDEVARTPFAGGFVSAFRSGRVWACQFHPEKSQSAGFQLIRNFLAHGAD